jgi:hypothetical protein
MTGLPLGVYMAKIVITIEDKPNDKVKVVSEPSFETIAKMTVSGEEMTSAHGYAIRCINAVMAESKAQNPGMIILPKVRSF